MKRTVLIISIFAVVSMVPGCILSTTPNETSLSIIAGDSITFETQIYPLTARKQWYLDGYPLAGYTGDSYVYSPKQADFGNHEVRVVEKSVFGEYSKTWKIKVSYVGWGSDELIESDMGIAEEPQIACDSHGNAITVWQLYDGTSYCIYSNRYEAGSGWGTAELIGSSSGHARRAEIACDSDGNAFVIWEQLDQENKSRWNIYSNSYIQGIGWGTAQQVESTSCTAFNPQIACDSYGNAFAVWNQYDGSGSIFSIYSNRYEAGVGWGTAQLIETGSGNAYIEAKIACDPEGNAIAVWNQYDGTSGISSIYSNRYEVGIGWGAAQLIESGIESASSPQIVCDSLGNAIAVWIQQDDSLVWSIYSNQYKAGIGWGTAQLIESKAEIAQNPQIACDPHGNAIAVWIQYNDSPVWSIYSNHYEVGVGWGTAQLIETGLGQTYPAQIACDPEGNAIAVWNQYDNDGHRFDIWSNRYDAGIGWGTSQIIESGLDDAWYPQIACGPDANFFTVWYQSDGISNSIYANTYGLHQP